jgi:hypothetical protein
MIQRGLYPRFGGGGGGGGDSITYTNLLPTYIPGVQEKVEEWMAAASTLSLSNFTAYPDPTYAAQNVDETDGIAAVATRGRYGSAVELDGKAFLRDLYDGLKINTNSKIAAYYGKKIEELLESFDEDVLPVIRDQYVFSFGGSEHNVAEAKAAKLMMAKINEIAKMFYSDYVKERSLQEGGMVHATPYGLQCIRDMEMLRTAGVYAREFDQGSKMDAWERWNEEAIIPVRNLDILGNSVRTILSTYRQETVKYYKPPLMSQIAGIAIAGLSLYTMFAGTSLNPYSKSNAPALGTKLENPNYQLSISGKEPGGQFFPND